jgi:uncharacterized membrane protein
MAISQIISILLAALVMGVLWGPWVGLTRSIATFEPDALLVIVARLSRNLAPLMTVLMPAALLSMIPVLIFTVGGHPAAFALTLAAFALFAVALAVTLAVEVPIVQQIESWTPQTLPGNWQELRDRWVSFHLLRVIPSIAGLALLVISAVRF